jgi:hypothetical protein
VHLRISSYLEMVLEAHLGTAASFGFDDGSTRHETISAKTLPESHYTWAELCTWILFLAF